MQVIRCTIFAIVTAATAAAGEWLLRPGDVPLNNAELADLAGQTLTFLMMVNPATQLADHIRTRIPLPTEAAPPLALTALLRTEVSVPIFEMASAAAIFMFAVGTG